MSKKVVNFIQLANQKEVCQYVDQQTPSTMKGRSEYLEIDCPSAKHTVAEMMLLVSCVVAISQLTYTAFAAPVESHPSPDASVKAPLIARQAGTYSGNDALGTYNCYKGGTWALQTSLNNSIYKICGDPVYDTPEFTPFSFLPNADGAYPQQQSDYQQEQGCFDVSTNCDSSPQKGKDYLHYTADIAAAQHANTADCEYAMGRVRDLCHGNNGWTRGGWYTFTDGTSYGCDVSHNGSNQ